MISNEDILAISAATAEKSVALGSWQELLTTVPFLEINPNTQRLAPMIFYNLRNAEGVPERNRLRGAYKHTWSKNLRLISVFLPVIEGLNSAKINYRVIKGVAIQLATGLLGARVVGDIDVVVSVVDLDKTIAIIEQHGFRCNTRAVCGYHSEGSSEVALGFNLNDNHIDLHLAERKEPRRLLVSMLSAPASFVALRNTNIAVPSAEALSLHAGLHGYRGASETDFVQALTDIAMLQPKISNLKLSQLARKTGMRTVWRRMTNPPAHDIGWSEVETWMNHPANPLPRGHQREPWALRIPRGLKLVIFRYPGLSALVTVFREFRGRRLAYASWLLLGQFAATERALVRKRGFLKPPVDIVKTGVTIQPFEPTSQSPGLTTSPISETTLDYRLSVRLSKDSLGTSFTLSSENLGQVNIAVYVNGLKVSKLSVGDETNRTFLLPNAHQVVEISMRPSHQSCEWCFHSLRDLKIQFLANPANPIQARPKPKNQ